MAKQNKSKGISSEEGSKVNTILQSSKIASTGFPVVPKISEAPVKFQFTQGRNDFSLYKVHRNFTRGKIIRALLLTVPAVVRGRRGRWSPRPRIIAGGKQVSPGSFEQSEFIPQKVNPGIT